MEEKNEDIPAIKECERFDSELLKLLKSDKINEKFLERHHFLSE